MDALVLRRRPGRRRDRPAKNRVTDRPNLLDGENLPPQPQQQRSQEKHARLKAAGLALLSEKG